jgi:hypothetical protein
MYDVAKGIRRQYFVEQGRSTTIMKMVEESCDGSVIPLAQHAESLTVSLLSLSPRVWIEHGTNYEEVFVEQVEDSLMK